MKKVIYLFSTFILAVLLVQCHTPKRSVISDREQQEYVANSLIIYYDAEIGKQELLEQVKSYRATVDYDYNNFNAIAITFPKNKSIEEAEAYFSKVKGVLQVSKNSVNQIQLSN